MKSWQTYAPKLITRQAGILPIMWNIINYVAVIVKEDGCHVRAKEGCWCNICSPLTLLKKKATMVGCW